MSWLAVLLTLRLVVVWAVCPTCDTGKCVVFCMNPVPDPCGCCPFLCGNKEGESCSENEPCSRDLVCTNTMREYETSEIFHHGEDDKKYEVVNSDQQNKINMMNGNEDIQEEIEEETKEQERLMQEKTTSVNDNYIVPVSTAKPPRPLGPGIIRKGDTNAILNSIVETYHDQEGRFFKPTFKKSRLVRDCKVGEWGEWGGCSSSCGVGEMVRTRAVLRPARRGGMPCPPLTQARWCGSPTANCTQTTPTTW